MEKALIVIILTLLFVPRLHAAQSVVTETEGYACMGDDKSRKETEQGAVKDAKRKATESAATYIQSETHVKDAMLEKDLISAYANAQVKVIQDLEKIWYKEEGLGDCYRVKLKVEVIPDEKAMTALAKGKQEILESDPSAPLSVTVWTDRKEYKQGDKVKLYLKGNKPFYGRVVYKDAGGKLLQLLPNPYRENNYFNGGSVYELPSGDDRYDMEVSPPFGSEGVTVYASTAPHGNLEVEASGAVFDVKTRHADIPIDTRGIKLSAKESGGGSRPAAAQFFEAGTELRTGL
jgi:hypothetical protein